MPWGGALLMGCPALGMLCSGDALLGGCPVQGMLCLGGCPAWGVPCPGDALLGEVPCSGDALFGGCPALGNKPPLRGPWEQLALLCHKARPRWIGSAWA